MPKTIKPTTILIDGCDLSGKTTLMEYISKKIPGIVFKITDRPFNDSKEERAKIKNHYRSILHFINTNRNTTVILDRFFPSELAYSKVKRGYETFDDTDFLTLEKSLMTRNHLFVLCDPGIDVLKQRLESRGDDYMNESDIEALNERYDRFYKRTDMNKLRLDTSKPVEKLLEQILKKI